MITVEAYTAPLVEPAVVPEIHVDGMAYVDRLGDTMKVVYFSLQRSIVSGEMERVVCLRLALPLAVVQKMEADWQRTQPLSRPAALEEGVAAHH